MIKLRPVSFRFNGLPFRPKRLWVDPRAYGVEADGVTDDAPALQRLIDGGRPAKS